ncbi:MAG TPA: tetratricopeptide repeat protein [Candidatus Hydrogenedentes bacterium]|nr:tetratricopeptide repeat protein [Candidatus Hydrogenedentota bacterium]
MPKTLSERWLAYKAHLAEHSRKMRTHEERPLEAVSGWIQETRKFTSRLVKGEMADQRKKAHHSVKTGVEAYNRGDYDLAERLFRKAVDADPGYARGYAYLGNALYIKGRFTEAVTMWNRATEVEPDSEAASMAKDKLLRLGHGTEDLVTNLKDQFRSR